MKLTFVLRDKKNALKLSTKTIESFMERIKTDTKDRAEVAEYTENLLLVGINYDKQQKIMKTLVIFCCILWICD